MTIAFYELWDQNSGNLIGDYDTAEAAYADVHQTFRRLGQKGIEALVLLGTDDEESVERVATGSELLAHVKKMDGAISYIGVGLYNIVDAARIIDATPNELRRWLNRDHYQSHGKMYRRLPFVARMLPSDVDVVTLPELMELRAIRELRRQGITMRRIRTLSEQLMQEWGVDFPLSSRRFGEEHQTDGVYIYSRTEGGAIRERGSGQLAVAKIVSPLLRDIDFSADGFALRFYPLTRESRVVLDAERQFGQPIDDPTGIPTRVLYMAKKANPYDSDDSIARWYDVPIEAVQEAFGYESSLAA